MSHRPSTVQAMTTRPPSLSAAPRAGLPRLAAFDIDGTLISRRGALSDRTAAALESLAEAGVITALATGRPWPQTEWILRLAPSFSYAVCLNGAVVMDAMAGERIADRSMTHFEAIEAAEIARKFLPDVSFGLDLADGRHLWEHRFAPQMPADLIADLSESRVADAVAGVDGPVLTWLVHVPDMSPLAIVDELSAHMPLGTEIRPSGLDMAEIAAAGVSKSAGLEIICQRYGIERRDVLVFGDGLNDVDMLRWAGLGVAMSNAGEMVRSAADCIAPTNEDDGVAVVLEAMLAGEGWPSGTGGGAFVTGRSGGGSDG